MKVKKLMTKSVGTCVVKDNLSEAMAIMWQKDCGIVPVINKKSKVVGTITDRDVAVSVFLQSKSAATISVSEVINGKTITCYANDKVEDVLKVMKKRQVKRIPVVNKKKKLVGIISITDILLASAENKKMQKKVFKTLVAIGKPHPIILKEVKE